jgi:signal transduction histidine kinase
VSGSAGTLVGTFAVGPTRRSARPAGWAHGTGVAKAIVPLRSLARTTAQACGVDRCSLFAWCEGFLLPVMSQFASGERRESLWRAFLGLGPYRLDDVPAFTRALAERRPILVRDTADERGLPPQWSTTFEAGSAIVVPLLRGDVVIGVALLDNGTANISRDQARRMRALGPYLASVIDSTLSLSELRRSAAPPEAALGNGHTAASTPELQETVRRITRLYARAAGVAIYAERVRMDNLLHDTLRQTLFSLGFRIEAALRRRPQRVSELRSFIREFKQDVALMMMQINQVVASGHTPVHMPWAELAEMEARLGLGLRDAERAAPDAADTPPGGPRGL